MKLTQARIERLLGMDCNTFCSIALNPGRTPTASSWTPTATGAWRSCPRSWAWTSTAGWGTSPRRPATEQRRAIAALKERINVLGEQISEKDELLDEDMVLSEEMDEAVHDVASGEADIRALESAEALLAEVIRQAEDQGRPGQGI